MIYSETFT